DHHGHEHADDRHAAEVAEVPVVTDDHEGEEHEGQGTKPGQRKEGCDATLTRAGWILTGPERWASRIHSGDEFAHGQGECGADHESEAVAVRAEVHARRVAGDCVEHAHPGGGCHAEPAD